MLDIAILEIILSITHLIFSTKNKVGVSGSMIFNGFIDITF
jgi:hypothetical protein